MAKLEILHYPDPRLRNRAQPIAQVTDDIRQLADDMLETMYDAPGIGLAATQVNVAKRLIVVDISEDKQQPLVLINPQMKTTSGQIETEEGRLVSCVQIAGWVARRVLTYIDVGDSVSRGQRYGFIRFGSRVDVYLPPDSEIVAKAGKWVLSGSDIIARLRPHPH